MNQFFLLLASEKVEVFSFVLFHFLLLMSHKFLTFHKSISGEKTHTPAKIIFNIILQQKLNKWITLQKNHNFYEN